MFTPSNIPAHTTLKISQGHFSSILHKFGLNDFMIHLSYMYIDSEQ